MLLFQLPQTPLHKIHCMSSVCCYRQDSQDCADALEDDGETEVKKPSGPLKTAGASASEAVHDIPTDR